MGGVNSVLPVISQGIQLASTISASNQRSASQDQALADLQAEQNERLRQSQEDAALERAEIQSKADEDERKRRDALRRSVARQRASFGSQGISGDGSGEAILLGLTEESEAQKQAREELDNLRLAGINQDIEQQKRLNLIQRSQLQESQRINNIGNGFNVANSATNFVGSLF